MSIATIPLLLALFAALHWLISKWLAKRPNTALLVSLLSCILALTPAPWMGDKSFMHYLYAITANLSIISTMSLVILMLHRTTKIRILSSNALVQIALAILLLGVILYPGALGLVAYDSYRLGFLPLQFGYLMLGLIVLLCVAGNYRVALIFALAWLGGILLTIASPTNLSTNLWDYVIDIWLFFWALGYLLVGLLRKLG